MIKVSLIAIIWVWHCVVYGQIPVDNFDPYNSYYVPYASTFVDQPTKQINYKTAAQLGESGELRTLQNIKNLLLQGFRQIKIKQQEATIASLKAQLKAMQSDLDIMTENVAKLIVALAVTKSDLAMKANQADLDQTNADVSNLNTALDDTNAILDSKANLEDLASTNNDVSTLSAKLDETNALLETKATQVELANTNSDVSNLRDKLSEISGELGTKASQAELDKTNTAVSTLSGTLEETNLVLESKATQADLDSTKGDVLTLSETLTASNENLAATQLDLEAAKNDISDLKELAKTNSIDRVPESCGDLQGIGHVKSGIYSVMADKQIKNVYCDFTKASDGADFQKLIGTVDMKSTPAYFYAQKTSSYSVANTVVPFESTKTNVGGAFDTATGEFTAPAAGKYFFVFSCLSSDIPTRVNLEVNSAAVAQTYGEIFPQTLTVHATLQLSKDDKVRMFLVEGSMKEDGVKFTNFAGWLIEEDELTRLIRAYSRNISLSPSKNLPIFSGHLFFFRR